jgi:hypothetical protein
MRADYELFKGTTNIPFKEGSRNDPQVEHFFFFHTTDPLICTSFFSEANRKNCRRNSPENRHFPSPEKR